MLRIDYLSVPGLPVLSFEVAAQECLAVEGPSGSGKTRLLRAIADLDPSEGYMFLEGIERRELAGPAWRRRVRYASAEPAWWDATARRHFGANARLDRLMSALALELRAARPAGRRAVDRGASAPRPDPRARRRPAGAAAR